MGNALCGWAVWTIAASKTAQKSGGHLYCVRVHLCPERLCSLKVYILDLMVRMKVGDCSFLYCSSTLLICNFCAWELYKLSLLCFSQCPFRTDYDFRIPFRTACMEKFSPSERTITSLSLDPMSQWADHSKKQFARWCHPMVFGGGSSTLRNLVLVCQQQQVELAGFGKGCLCVCACVGLYSFLCIYACELYISCSCMHEHLLSVVSLLKMSWIQ